MKAEAKSLKFLGESPQKITVPFFQRRYVWEEKNWKELFDNVKDPDNKPFLGSIILKLSINQNPTEASVIDGQQRLTTLTILAKAVHDSLPEESRGGIRHDLEYYLYYKINASDDFENSLVKIEHSKFDIDDYNLVVKSGLLTSEYIDLEEIKNKSSKILKCYYYFMKELEKMGIADRKKIHDNLFNDSRKMLVLITLDSQDINEQTIFDTINRAGVRLSGADIIKNDLFKKCLDKSTTEREKKEIYELYDQNWGDVFYQEGDELSIWDKDRVFGNNQRTNLEFLLYCVAAIKWGKNDKIFSDLPSVFNEKTRAYSRSQLIQLVKEINSYANVFYDYVLKLQKDLKQEDGPTFKFNDYINRLLLILENFGVQMFYPYVLLKLKERDDKIAELTKIYRSNLDELKVCIDSFENQLSKELLVLESFVMRRRLARKSVSDYANKCDQIIKDGINVLKEEFVTDTNMKDISMREYLNSVKNDAARMILFWIELSKRNDDRSDITVLEYKYTLEHIMPVKWSPKWDSVSLLNDDGTQEKDEDGNEINILTDAGKNIREKHIYSIGNMTLLTQNLNSSIRNNIYSVKMDGNGVKKPGYKAHSSLYLTAELIKKYYDGDTAWDERHIRARTKELYEKFISIWPANF
jgi:uncharacterized protein with ParB-like and HNH nuclease domain